MWIPVVLAGGVIALIFLLKPGQAAAETPPPGPIVPPGQPSPVRAMTYVQRIDSALLAWRTVKLVSGPAAQAAGSVLRSTTDVVKAMAATDAAKGQITAADLAAVNAKVDSALKELGG